MGIQLIVAALLFSVISPVVSNLRAQKSEDYGLDVTFPVHHQIDETKYPYFAKRYQNLLEGCYKQWSKDECDNFEEFRMNMVLEQPASQHNYTELGFRKVRVPPDLWEIILAFYHNNADKEKMEEFSTGYTIVNFWDSPSFMTSLEDPDIPEAQETKQKIWDGVRPIIEEWVGRPVYETSLYGIRKYTNGAILATHVDSLPLVSSCIINVAQDVDEPWPIEVFSHAGKAYNVTMEPGDMVLYESHTIPHGRPFPLNGKYFANIFVHYKPYDHEENNEMDMEAAEASDRLRHTDAAKRFSGYGDRGGAKGASSLHLACGKGNLHVVRLLLEDGKHDHLINIKDENGWTPLNEAIKHGDMEMIRLLVDKGADFMTRTKGEFSTLFWAKKLLGKDHEVVEYFQSLGVSG